MLSIRKLIGLKCLSLKKIQLNNTGSWIQIWEGEVTREPLYHYAVIVIILDINKIIYYY